MGEAKRRGTPGVRRAMAIGRAKAERRIFTGSAEEPPREMIRRPTTATMGALAAMMALMAGNGRRR